MTIYRYNNYFIQFKMISELQKKSLNKLLQRYTFEHLRPPPEIYETIIPQNELFLVTGSDRRRRIFYKVQYQIDELQAIQEVKQKLRNESIIHPYGDEIILKHIYGAKWNIDKAFNRIQQLLAFHTNQKIVQLDNRTIQNLQMGSFYSYGHDRGMRPNVIMRIDKIDFNQQLEESFNAFYYLMLVVLGFKMVPYHAQKYNLIMDFNDISLADIPYVFLYDSLEKLGIYYCCNTEKTFLYNSEGISNIWRMISFFLPENQKKRIIFINKGQEKKILEYIDQYELQRRYGGKLTNLTTFWPPKNTNESFDIKLNEEKSQESFYSAVNNEDFFELTKTQSFKCGGPSCQCQIY